MLLLIRRSTNEPSPSGRDTYLTSDLHVPIVQHGCQRSVLETEKQQFAVSTTVAASAILATSTTGAGSTILATSTTVAASAILATSTTAPQWQLASILATSTTGAASAILATSTTGAGSTILATSTTGAGSAILAVSTTVAASVILATSTTVAASTILATSTTVAASTILATSTTGAGSAILADLLDLSLSWWPDQSSTQQQSAAKSGLASAEQPGIVMADLEPHVWALIVPSGTVQKSIRLSQTSSAQDTGVFFSLLSALSQDNHLLEDNACQTFDPVFLHSIISKFLIKSGSPDLLPRKQCYR
ncbi:hypothetical protein Bbelb_165400 [Branchiostoma belcheri]|nr:hypothetical protein Bbelb_165400 [Branchiostoma belcheri]